MIPFTKLPRDVQTRILAVLILSGSATTASSCSPIVCDPPPPPSMTPMICDAAPRPPVTPASPSPTAPMICDPTVPPPTVTATSTITPTITPAPSSASPSMTPMICDAAPRPPVTATSTITPGEGPEITPVICDPAPPPSTPKPESRRDSTSPALPLAEIRTVEIVWAGGLAFNAETPWPEARYLWSTSGGQVVATGTRVEWQPPADPGRYLLQVVADWGPMGLAVDSITLAVYPDGSVRLG